MRTTLQIKILQKKPESNHAKPEIHHEPQLLFELAQQNIIFSDKYKHPLYTLLQLECNQINTKRVYTDILAACHEAASHAKAIPMPNTGIYAGMSMDQVMGNLTEAEIMIFLNYVKRFPRGYVGKNFRITESFAGWVVSGTPVD